MPQSLLFNCSPTKKKWWVTVKITFITRNALAYCFGIFAEFILAERKYFSIRIFQSSCLSKKQLMHKFYMNKHDLDLTSFLFFTTKKQILFGPI